MIKKLLQDQSGTSIVSVLAAFVILLIGISMFTTAALAALNITNRSLKIRNSVDHVMEEYYLGEGGIWKEERSFQFSLYDEQTGISADFEGVQKTYENTIEDDAENKPFVLYCFELPKKND